MNEASKVFILRIGTVIWGIAGTTFAIACIYAQSSLLDIWWTISGVFGAPLLGLFVLAFLRISLPIWKGALVILTSFLVTLWGTFVRDLPQPYSWLSCQLDPILIGTVATLAMLIVAIILNRGFSNAKD